MSMDSVANKSSTKMAFWLKNWKDSEFFVSYDLMNLSYL